MSFYYEKGQGATTSQNGGYFWDSKPPRGGEGGQLCLYRLSATGPPQRGWQILFRDLLKTPRIESRRDPEKIQNRRSFAIGRRGIFRIGEKFLRSLRNIPRIKISLRCYLTKFPVMCCEIQCLAEAYIQFIIVGGQAHVFEPLAPGTGDLLTVSHVVAMFVCLIMSALKVLRRVVSLIRVLLYITYRESLYSIRKKLPIYYLGYRVLGNSWSDQPSNRLSKKSGLKRSPDFVAKTKSVQ